MHQKCVPLQKEGEEEKVGGEGGGEGGKRGGTRGGRGGREERKGSGQEQEEP